MFNSFRINYEKVKITMYGLWIAWRKGLNKNINEISEIFHREEGRGSTHSTNIYCVLETDPNALKHEINQLECISIVTCLTFRDPNYT
jgi:hypothetical protein